MWPHDATKAERRAARERVSTYYEQELAKLLERVGEAIDKYRAGELDVHDVDDLIHRYKRAARRLYSFCWDRGGGSHVVFIAHVLDEPELGSRDWWEEAEPRRR